MHCITTNEGRKFSVYDWTFTGGVVKHTLFALLVFVTGVLEFRLRNTRFPLVRDRSSERPPSAVMGPGRERAGVPSVGHG